MDRRTFLRLAALGLAAPPLLAACGDDEPAVSPTPSGPAGTSLDSVGADATAGLQVIAAQPELLAGVGRFAFGLLRADNTPLTDVTVDVYAGLRAGEPPRLTAKGSWLREGVEDKALYVAPMAFPTPGEWLVAAVARPKDGPALRGGTRITVGATSPSPVPGQRATSVVTPTTTAPAGADPLCSRRPVCSMHGLSLDAALRTGRPTVVAFSAPSFCETQTCGPVVEIVDRAARATPDVQFVHVEAYREQGRQLAPALSAWKFTSEPWTYFVGRDGVVVDRIAGALGAEEVTARLARLRG